MATLIVEVDDGKVKMVKDVLKAMGVSVQKKTIKVEKAPNETTRQAIEDALNGNVTKVESVEELFKNI